MKSVSMISPNVTGKLCLQNIAAAKIILNLFLPHTFACRVWGSPEVVQTKNLDYVSIDESSINIRNFVLWHITLISCRILIDKHKTTSKEKIQGEDFLCPFP